MYNVTFPDCLHESYVTLLRFHESSKFGHRLDIKDIYVTWVMHLAVTDLLLFFFIFGTNSAYLQRNTCSVSAIPVCSYDRSRIKRSDIFSQNIRPREIEAKSDKPARIFLLLFSLFWKLRAYVECIRYFINDVGGTRSLFSFFLTLLNRYKSRFSQFPLVQCAALLTFFRKLYGLGFCLSILSNFRQPLWCIYRCFIDSFNLKSSASVFSKYAVRD